MPGGRPGNLVDDTDERMRDDLAVDLGDPDNPASVDQAPADDLGEGVIEVFPRRCNRAVLERELTTEPCECGQVAARRSPDRRIHAPEPYAGSTARGCARSTTTPPGALPCPYKNDIRDPVTPG